VRVHARFGADQLTCDLKTIKKYAFPRLIEKFLNNCVLKDLF